MMERLVGGFFALQVSGPAASDSVMARWSPATAESWLMHSGRGALKALWELTGPASIWLPAYICDEVAKAVPMRFGIRYFPLDEFLRPSIPFLDTHLKSGDHVLAVDYFGRPAAAEFVAFVESRRDIGWVQDCSHALEGCARPWGDWLLYSPRKLLGVPDGGILVAHSKPLPTLVPGPLTDPSFVLPSLERLEDREEMRNEQWYARYLETESRISADRSRMSTLSLSILGQTPLSVCADARRRNYEVLQRGLAPWAFISEEANDFAPLGFPIRTHSANKVSVALASIGIFAPRHWPSLPSSRTEFALEHQLAESLLTLPCDQRYGELDMQRVSDAAMSLLSGDND